MKMRSDFLARLKIDVPIFQAPLAGGGDTPALVAAVGAAGGLGFIGAAYLTPAQILVAAREVRARTQRPFGVNLFAPGSVPDEVDPAVAIAAVTPYFDEFGLPAPTISGGGELSFDKQLEATLESGASIFSFTLGRLPSETVARIKEYGLFVLGTASTVEEAIALEAAGVDGIVVQGAEAGGHRCTFAGPHDAGLIGTFALVPQVVDAVRVPVVASGGVMDGRGIVAALALGASAVQMGTAFLTTEEAGVPSAYRDAILGAREDQTRLTRAFSGRPARGIVNRFMREVDEIAVAQPDAILPFPKQNALTRPLRAAGARANRDDVLSLWAGQGIRLARRSDAATLVERLSSETASTLARLAAIAAASRYDLDRQVRSDRAQDGAFLAQAFALRIWSGTARLVGRLWFGLSAVLEGVCLIRGAPPLGDVGNRGSDLTDWVETWNRRKNPSDFYRE